MKKNKFIAFVSAMALAATYVTSSAVSVFAADPELKLEYNAQDSTVDVYLANIPDFWVADFTISMPATITKATWAFDETVGLYFDTKDYSFIDNKLSMNMASSGDGMTVSESGTKLGTITLTIADNSADIVLNVVEASTQTLDEITYDTMGGGLKAAPLTIPAVGGGDTKVDFPGSEALTSNRYADYTNTVPVDAWSTKIDWSKYNAVAKLFWSISNGSETKKVEATMAEVTGDIDTEVTYGLAIAGQADELNTITEVKLVVE